MKPTRTPTGAIQWILAAAALFLVYQSVKPARPYILILLGLIAASIFLKGGVGTQLYNLTNPNRKNSVTLDKLYLIHEEDKGSAGTAGNTGAGGKKGTAVPTGTGVKNPTAISL